MRSHLCVWYVCHVLYAVLYIRSSCFVVHGCAVSRWYINVCNCDIFSVVNVYPDHLKFCAVCIDGRRYVCYRECNVVSYECNESTSCLVQPIDMHGGEVLNFGCVCFRGELGFLNCDDICICVVNKQLYPCILCGALLMYLYVLCVANCLVNNSQYVWLWLLFCC